MACLKIVIPPFTHVLMPPLGPAALVAYLRNKYADVEVLDLNVSLLKMLPKSVRNSRDYAQIADHAARLCDKIFRRWAENPDADIEQLNALIDQILSGNPHIVGFSYYFTNFLLFPLASRVKEEDPELKIVVGGPTATFSYREILEGSFGVDFVVLGEGEIPLSQLYRVLVEDGDIRSVDGIAYRDGDGKIIAKDVTLIDDLNSLPIPDFEGFSLKDYFLMRVSRGRSTFLPLETSRGCVFNCAYCQERILWRTYREKRPERVVEELEHVKKKYGAKGVWFWDSLLNARPGRLERICDAIRSSGVNVEWGGSISIANVSINTVGKLYDAGCRFLQIGMESASTEVLRSMRKPVDVEKAALLIKKLSDAGIWVHIFFMVGFPTERWEDFEESLNFLIGNADYIDSISVSPFSPAENTPIVLNPQTFNISDLRRLVIRTKKGNIPCGFSFSSPHVDEVEVERRLQVMVELAEELGILIGEFHPLFYMAGQEYEGSSLSK